ncbi:hypothetical protein [Nostoc sp. FACHB-190]|uniref:hypothetical protein n=1 Tax=Nostoc sp. FACHB-190 TaxID=2692838 RepID=UPI001683ED4D|nr:hypothetical protein [Nostoc sp. FACHB-190]MBD2303040.1 hypothetical protein [Nostoc sp. FACHB-190]
MTTENRISIIKAASKLGVPEASIREAIRPLYPDNWERIKNIKLSQFDLIAEALRDLTEAAKPFKIEGETDYNAENNAFYFGESVDLENAAECGFHCNLPTDITIAEPNDLTTQQAQHLKVSVVRTFSDMALDLNRITSAMAYSAALQNFASFKEIHSATFRHYTAQYVEEFSDEYQQILNDLEVKCNPKSFLEERGILTTG